MGTANDRAAANTNYYSRGDVIPGFKVDAQNVLIVRETMKFTKDWCINKGPMFIEYSTYRYHGHSMSDPGVTYRTRDEIKHVRDYRDPIMLCKHMLIENSGPPIRSSRKSRSKFDRILRTMLPSFSTTQSQLSRTCTRTNVVKAIHSR